MNLPPVAAAPFLAEPLVRKVLAILSEEGETARVVGGAVRDYLLGSPSAADVDIATTCLPEAIIARAEAAGLRTAPTGIEHGTVTVIGEASVVEVTTLRVDVETDGRRAVVHFGRDWQRDAERRDFTMNALSVDAEARLYDPVGGVADLAARRVRFIGDADRRIAEDRLRALRFFRFHAAFGEGAPDPEGLGAAIRARQALSMLSAERVGQEMRRLVMAKGAVPTVALMQESGILPLVAASVADLAAFARLPALEEGGPSAALRFAVLFGRVQEDIDRITRRFRLSNSEHERMRAALAAAPALADDSESADRAALYRLGPVAFADGLVLAGARGSIAAGAAARRRRLVRAWAVPVFPLTGRDVVEGGIGRGPAVGVLLRALERWWIAEDFAPDADALRKRLQIMIAAQQ